MYMNIEIIVISYWSRQTATCPSSFYQINPWPPCILPGLGMFGTLFKACFVKIQKAQIVTLKISMKIKQLHYLSHYLQRKKKTRLKNYKLFRETNNDESLVVGSIWCHRAARSAHYLRLPISAIVDIFAAQKKAILMRIEIQRGCGVCQLEWGVAQTGCGES